jgi:hypothetical protein
MTSRPKQRQARRATGTLSPPRSTPNGRASPQPQVDRGVGKLRRPALGRTTWDLLGAAIAVLIVAAPMLFTNSGFAVDFTNHLWLTWAAGKALAQAGHPSYFLNAFGVGVFYPWFAFYGGTLYTIVGATSELLGDHAIVAYVGVTTLAIAGTYLSIVWLGRELGLRSWVSHAPALAVVTSAAARGPS